MRDSCKSCRQLLLVPRAAATVRASVRGHARPTMAKGGGQRGGEPLLGGEAAHDAHAALARHVLDALPRFCSSLHKAMLP